ncbi:MAG TPA: phophatidylserine decarboxylase associated domain-containing protein [Thermoanaerobaculia bacterium]|nr:phophatidylserine decarboxylase associated domain-containing protein [Thermoanaerobaculia bacterium]
MILDAERTEYAPSIAELDRFIDTHEVIRYLVNNACRENLNLVETYPTMASTGGVAIPRIKDKETLLHGFNTILKHPPFFVNNELVGLPFSAWVVGIDPTLSGVALFGLPMFNRKMSAVLREWFEFLGTPPSAVGFTEEGKQWLSPQAKAQYQFDDWKKDQDKLPYWTSWNSFFTRLFKDPARQRPIADPDSNRTAIAANDGSLFRWASNIASRDVFWFKDMAFSLADILSSPVKEQQDLIDKHDLVKIFTNGYIFQTYLNPYNFHRWWVPVNGEVLFDPFTIPGDFFNKLVIPDFGGATTASLPYLVQVNARGVIVIKTPDYGHVCCIPLGMSEVSTVTFDEQMCAGAKVTKGMEMGKFNYGGSSFVIIYENLPHKKLIFMDAEGNLSPENPVAASSSAGTGGVVTNIGAKIGQWVDI